MQAKKKVAPAIWQLVNGDVNGILGSGGNLLRKKWLSPVYGIVLFGFLPPSAVPS